jgi:hypothetical protein
MKKLNETFFCHKNIKALKFHEKVLSAILYYRVFVAMVLNDMVIF